MVKALVCHIKDHGFKSRFSRLFLVMLKNYSYIFILFLISVILSSLFFFLSYFLAVQKEDTEKVGAYECGFEPYEDAREIFDIKFYLIALFFIVFDLEAVFLFPWSITLSSISNFSFWVMIDFLIELVIGYAYIYNMGALSWE